MVEAMVALVRGGLGVVGAEQGNPQLAGLDHQETIGGIGVERLRQAPDHIVKADQPAGGGTDRPHLSFMQ